MAIKIEKLKEEKKKGKIFLLLKGTDEVFANTLRRLVLEEVPTLAIEEVEVKDNNSALYDEMVALRLGLIPIKTDLSSYRFPENEAEITEKSARCTLQIKLKASGKGYVYAEQAESADPKCTFVYPKMPIVKLLPKQKIDVTMTAILGRGKDHAKWTPGTAFYKKEQLLKVGKVENPTRLAENNNEGVFTINGTKVEVNPEKMHESHLLDYYAELDKGITTEYTDKIIFTLESWGQLNCKEILQQCATILGEKIEALEAQI